MAKDNPGNFKLGNSGTEKRWATPGELEADIAEYFAWCEANPIIRIEYNGKDALRCEVPTERPPTIEGLALRLGTGRQTLLNYQNKEGYEPYFDIITRAKRKIIDQQLTFGLVGAYNANVLRLIMINNTQYRDKMESDQRVTQTITNVTPQVLSTGSELLDKEG